MKIKKNDIVKVISGDFKGKIGKILKVFPHKNSVQIENIGFFKKHMKSRINRKYPDGGIIEKLKTINISNVMFFAKKINRPVRLGFIINKDRKKYRIFKEKNVSYTIIN